MAKAKKKKEEKATDVFVGWCVDRSGSMGGLERDTIDGFNAWVKDQQGQEGNMWLSLVLFDDHFDAPIVAVDIEEVPKLTADTYFVRGMTALYDAVGSTIAGIEGWVKNHPSFDGKVLVNIWTDGGENSSTNWSAYNGGLQKMLDKIREKQAEGWTFAFMGSGGAAWTEGQHFHQVVGARNTTQVTNTAAGTRMSYAASSGGTRLLRGGQSFNANASMTAATLDSSVLAAYGVAEDDVEEALAGTSNSSE